jgi:hypothetical protein
MSEITDRKWLAIDVVLRVLGTANSMHMPTFCISAADAEDPIWWDILPVIQRHMREGLHLDILYSTTLSLVKGDDGPDRPDNYTTAQSYDQVVEMGSLRPSI